ncbi:mCG141893, partial [Mus musculus]
PSWRSHRGAQCPPRGRFQGGNCVSSPRVRGPSLTVFQDWLVLNGSWQRKGRLSCIRTVQFWEGVGGMLCKIKRWGRFTKTFCKLEEFKGLNSFA